MNLKIRKASEYFLLSIMLLFTFSHLTTSALKKHPRSHMNQMEQLRSEGNLKIQITFRSPLQRRPEKDGPRTHVREA